MPILIDIEEPAGRKHQRWVFYGALLSMDNVNEETMLKIPKLLEFIAHARKDGGITFYTRFTRGLFLEKQSFLSDMEKLGIKIDPESIVERMGQPPHYGVTKGRVCTDSPVDFHWRADGAHRGGPSKSKKRRIQDPSSETKRDYDEMTMGEIIELIKRYPEIASRMTAATRVGDRRWNIDLKDGPRLLLPADDPAKALDLVSELQVAEQLLERAVTEVDLRIAGSMSLRLEDDAANSRRDSHKSRIAAAKPGRGA